MSSPALIQATYRRLRTGWGRAVPDAGDRRVYAAGAAVGTFAVLAQVATLAKDLAVAGVFGTSDAVDAFLIAFLFPSYAINVLGGAIASAVVPVYVHAREHGGAGSAHRLLGSVLIFTALLLVGTALALAAAFPVVGPLVASGFPAEKLQLTRSLFHLLLPVLVLAGISSVWSAVLNAEGAYAGPSAATLAVPLSILAAVLLLPHWGAYTLAGGVLAGTATQCALLATALRRRRLPVAPLSGRISPDLRIVLGQYAPLLVGSLLAGATAIIDSSMAAALPSGSVATLNFGSKIVLGLVTVGTYALGAALLPHFSEMVARGQWAELRAALHRYSRLVLGVAVPVTAMIVIASQALIRILFERGAFTAADTADAAFVQAAFALQLPFVLGGVLFVRVLSSMRRASVMMWGAMITLPLDIVLNLLLMPYLGIAGVALSTSIVYAVSFVFLRSMTLRLLPAEASVDPAPAQGGARPDAHATGAGALDDPRLVEHHRRMLGDLGHVLPPGAAVLDFGCGTGHRVYQYRKAGYRAFGADFDPRWEEAERRCTAEGLAEGDEQVCRELQREPYRLPFADATFDFVFSEQVFEHVRDYATAVAEIHRVLKPGGVTLHDFPSKLRPIEPHVRIPLAGVWQARWYLRAWAALGIRNEFQRTMPADAVTRRNLEYLRGHTTYLTKRQIREHFARHFPTVRFVEANFVQHSWGRIRYLAPIFRAVPPLGAIVSTFHTRVVFARRD